MDLILLQNQIPHELFQRSSIFMWLFLEINLISSELSLGASQISFLRVKDELQGGTKFGSLIMRFRNTHLADRS